MKTIVTMTDRGRITLPANVRKELHLEGEMPFELETTGGEIVLRPALVIPREDAWAYTRDHRTHVQKAEAQPAFAISREEMTQIIDADDPVAVVEQVIATHRHE